MAYRYGRALNDRDGTLYYTHQVSRLIVINLRNCKNALKYRWIYFNGTIRGGSPCCAIFNTLGSCFIFTRITHVSRIRRVYRLRSVYFLVTLVRQEYVGIPSCKKYQYSGTRAVVQFPQIEFTRSFIFQNDNENITRYNFTIVISQNVRVSNWIIGNIWTALNEKLFGSNISNPGGNEIQIEFVEKKFPIKI